MANVDRKFNQENYVKRKAYLEKPIRETHCDGDRGELD
jgi:hypothetical protein